MNRSWGKTMIFAERVIQIINEGKTVGVISVDSGATEIAAIVRCKDCEHFNDHAIRVYGSDCGSCEDNGMMCPPDWFCADGIKKNSNLQAP